MVPLYEEREAARFAGYNWTAWRDLDWADRSAAVAHYRIHAAVDMHQQAAVSKEVTRRTKRPGAN